MLENLPDVLTRREVSNIFRVGKKSILEWERAGQLKYVKINDRGVRRYLKSDIVAKIEACEKASQQEESA